MRNIENERTRTVEGVSHIGGFPFETRISARRRGSDLNSLMVLRGVQLDAATVLAKMRLLDLVERPDAYDLVRGAVASAFPRMAAAQGERG